MYIEVTAQAIDPWRAISDYQARIAPRDGAVGATAVFVGTTRDDGEIPAVQRMELEHYPGMTERNLRLIAEQAHARWPIHDSLIIHRVGQLAPGDTIVVVATWAKHRAPALQGCQFLIEELKHRAPFWKKETGESGSHWVAANTPGTIVQG